MRNCCNDEILWFIILFLLLFCGCGNNRRGFGPTSFDSDNSCNPCGC